ncbi:hypothetical protein ANSO36C_62750 (plasmid) [Nostoc cf. commune SO-36]|uniref:Uncharacterized protein n=1 Tax=Nostoc cf. commune SO-36 TaxID=449208 RepID=A0ABM7ZB42_NOSCO|nr:hypothetical protein [Nostoc commune]BDI20473.1 hypothetical protein ANSO36C_62750 [Nostoc cf. commune SO-36]
MMTKFQDPRAAALAQQIDQINAIGWGSACDLALQNHAVKGGLSPVETVLRFDMFLARTEETANKRKGIWAEQLSQGISGIEWYTVEYGGMAVELPRLCEELTLVPGDKEILVQSKSVALDFLAHWNMVFKLWHYDREAESRWNQSRWSEFYAEYLHGQWLELWAEDEVYQIQLKDGTLLDKPTFAINACCCWGNPEAIHRTAAYSEAGSSWFQWNNFTPWK